MRRAPTTVVDPVGEGRDALVEIFFGLDEIESETRTDEVTPFESGVERATYRVGVRGGVQEAIEQSDLVGAIRD